MDASEKKYGVFISYSHEDANIVSTIASLLGSMRNDLVFQDTKNLELGKKWKPQLFDALRQAEIVVIFWCQHSEASEFVKKEYREAIKLQKKIIPVYLDKTKLNRALAPYQGINLGPIMMHHDYTSPAMAKPMTPKKSKDLDTAWKNQKNLIPFLLMPIVLVGLWELFAQHSRLRVLFLICIIILFVMLIVIYQLFKRQRLTFEQRLPTAKSIGTTRIPLPSTMHEINSRIVAQDLLNEINAILPETGK